VTRKPALGAGGGTRRRAAGSGLATLLALLAGCGSFAARPTDSGGSPTAGVPRATAPGGLTLVPAPTRTPTVTPTPEPVFTALQALEIALPRLRQLHPRGLVMGISGSTRISRTEWAPDVREWVVDVWVPDQGRSLQYGVVAGVLRGAATSSTISPGGLAPVMPLADELLPADLIDSDRAEELADSAGAGDFKRQERAQLRMIDLGGRLDGSLVWHVFMSRLGTDGASLVVDVDARTGAILALQDGRLRPTQTPASW
jgi:hypothetical protein